MNDLWVFAALSCMRVAEFMNYMSFGSVHESNCNCDFLVCFAGLSCMRVTAIVNYVSISSALVARAAAIVIFCCVLQDSHA